MLLFLLSGFKEIEQFKCVCVSFLKCIFFFYNSPLLNHIFRPLFFQALKSLSMIPPTFIEGSP